MPRGSLGAGFLGFCLAAGIAPSADAGAELADAEQECFSMAMIGYDYVINSRVGVPLERALRTVTVNTASPAVHAPYKKYLTRIVRQAYQWQGSPHDYAVKVIYRCASLNALNTAGRHDDAAEFPF